MDSRSSSFGPCWIRAGLGLAILCLPLLSALRATADATLPTRHHEWFDAKGRLIKRLYTDGRLVLYTWDDSGRLVKIAGLAHRYKLADVKAGRVAAASEAWAHCFSYGAKGQLEVETDCFGVQHKIVDPAAAAAIFRSDTCLAGHKHGEEEGSHGSVSAGETLRVVYDEDGNVIEVERAK